MKLAIGLFLILALTAIRILAQESDVCTISSFVIPSTAKEQDIEKYKPIEVAKVDISRVTQGTRLSRTFRVQATQLWTYVEIFFADDMKFYDSLYEAMTIDIVFSTARKRTKNNIVSLTTTQTAFDDGFKQTDVVGYAKAPGKRIGILVSCRGKKPKG